MKNILLTALAAFPILVADAQAQSVSGEVDLFELHIGQGDEHFVFDAAVEVGGDTHGVAFRFEGGSDVGPHIHEVTTQLLYTLVPAEGTTIFAGVRHDFRGGSDLTHASLAVVQDIGEVASAEHFLFVSQHGDVTGAAMVVASLPVLSAFSIEPRLALGWSAQDILDEELGSGVTDVEFSVRVRRDIGPLLNIYAGVIQERLVGQTRDIALANGDRGTVNRVIVGAGLAF